MNLQGQIPFFLKFFFIFIIYYFFLHKVIQNLAIERKQPSR